MFVLRVLPNGTAPRTIDAMFALARRGLTMLLAKRTIEALVEDGRVLVDLPTVEAHTALTQDLAEARIAAMPAETRRSTCLTIRDWN